jgi:hypothetical protein
MLRVLIGTLFSGEQEFARAMEALKAQRHVSYRTFAIEHLPERAAHDKLHERFMEHAHAYDLFLKLDADMILVDDNALGTAVAVFEQDPHLEHAVFTVHDWMSGSDIEGIHMYRSRVTWAKCDASAFPDPAPQNAARSRRFRGPPSPLAAHGPDPSPAQAFRYGLHRGLRAFPAGLPRARPVDALRHWRLLKRVWRNFERTLDPRMGLALLGVEHTLTHRLAPADCNYTNPRFWQLLDQYAPMDPLEMRDHLARTWRPALRRELMWAGALTRRLARRHRRVSRPESRPSR